MKKFIIGGAILFVVVGMGVYLWPQISSKEEGVVLVSNFEWPANIPKEIPSLQVGTRDSFKDLSSLPRVFGQPEKLLFVLEVSKFTETDIKNYLDVLKQASWKIETAKPVMTGNLLYRAEKGMYIIEIEENPKGPDTAYHSILLSKTESGKEPLVSE